jgi:hypothetical protein
MDRSHIPASETSLVIDRWAYDASTSNNQYVGAVSAIAIVTRGEHIHRAGRALGNGHQEFLLAMKSGLAAASLVFQRSTPSVKHRLSLEFTRRSFVCG